MKRFKWLVLLLVGLVLMGCVTSRQFVPLKPGKITLYNHNQGMWAKVFVFKGHIHEDKMIRFDRQTGQLKWAFEPEFNFTVSPAIAKNRPVSTSAFLVPDAEYTLYVRFKGLYRHYGDDVVYFRTEINSNTICRQHLIGSECASVIVDLPRVNYYSPRQLKFNVIIR